MEPVGQNVQQTALMNSFGMSVIVPKPRPAVAAVILVAEGYAKLVEADQPAVRDGHAVGVAGEIGEHHLKTMTKSAGIHTRMPAPPVWLSVIRQPAPAARIAEQFAPARCLPHRPSWSATRFRSGRTAGPGRASARFVVPAHAHQKA